MKILGIETSCDETGAAIVKDGTKILSNIVASSQKIHIKTGGVIPERAAREQIKSIIPVLEESLAQAEIDYQDIDALAVTYGPGLIGSLLVGVETAKTLAYVWQKPIIPVNHLLAHVYANWITNSKPQLKSQNLLEFPLIALIVSGGHTELIYMTDHGKYEWLGGTRDDAAGEAFDKIARLLNLGYPGGPAIATAAATTHNTKNLTLNTKLPRPMIDSDDYDFSFSGLKTAVLRETQHLKLNTLEKSVKSSVLSALAFETQEAITDVLVRKTLKAAAEKNVKNILLAGGVAANSRLREKFQSQIPNSQFPYPYRLFVPPPSLCTDNAAAVASCAYFNNSPSPWNKVSVQPGLELSSEI